MIDIKQILKDAKKAPSKNVLDDYRESIETLRNKEYSWREIATFLNDHDVKTDHTKIFRFMNKKRKKKMDNYENYFVPSSDKYKDVLKSIEKDISENQMIMLKHHYHSHNRMATYAELAEVAGFSGKKGAEIQYGSLGRLIGEKLNMVFAPMEDDKPSAGPWYSSSIASNNPFRANKQDLQLLMNHEIAKALEQLNWVN